MDWLAELNDTIEMENWFEIQSSDAKELRDFILEKDAEIERLRKENDLLANDRDGYVQLLTDENNRLREALQKINDINADQVEPFNYEIDAIVEAALQQKENE